jgi:hypothetical protein
VARLLDPNTDRFVVVAAGVARGGTVAAGEFPVDGHRLDELARRAPKDWSHKNIEVVLETQVIDGLLRATPNRRSLHVVMPFMGVRCFPPVGSRSKAVLLSASKVPSCPPKWRTGGAVTTSRFMKQFRTRQRQAVFILGIRHSRPGKLWCVALLTIQTVPIPFMPLSSTAPAGVFLHRPSIHGQHYCGTAFLVTRHDLCRGANCIGSTEPRQ